MTIKEYNELKERWRPLIEAHGKNFEDVHLSNLLELESSNKDD